MSGLFRSVRVGWRGKGAVPTTPSLSSPVLSIAPVITGITQVSQTLSVSTGTWLNSPTDFSYQWYRGATPVGTNAAAYTLVVGDIGSTMSCVVTAANGSGSTNAATSSVGPVIDLVPANSVLPAITGTPTLGQTLSASTGTWTHSPTSYAYQWNRAGSPIASANAATYLLVGADVGTTITCTVTATNSGGSTPATSASIGPVNSGSSSLTISTAPRLSGDAIVGQTIFATTGTYSATPDSYTPTWSVGGVVQSDQTGTTLLVLDQYLGSPIGYSEIAHKASYTDSPSNAATSTGAVANISLTNAITAFSRTSASGDNTSATGLVFSVTFGSNVYEGYFLDAKVYSDSGLSTRTQHVVHTLTHADLQAGATIDLLSDGLTKLGPNDWLQLGVFTTSPNGLGYTFTSTTTISPTDGVTGTTFNPSDKAATVVITNSNLDAQNASGSYAGVRATTGKAIGSGKYYFEYLVQDATNTLCFGIANAAETLVSYPGSDGNGISYIDVFLSTYFNGSAEASGGPAVAATHVVGVAVDLVNNLFWAAVDNANWTCTSSPSANPSTGTKGQSFSGLTGTVYPIFTAKSGKVTGRFTSASQTYAPPTGFTAWG